MADIIRISNLSQYSINFSVQVLVTRKTLLKKSVKGFGYFLFGVKDSSGELQCCCFEESKFDVVSVGEWYLIKGSKLGLNKYNRKLEMTLTKETTINKIDPITDDNLSTFSTMFDIIHEKQNGDVVDLKGIFESEGVVKKVKVSNGGSRNKFFARVTDEQNLELAIYLNAWESNIPVSYKKGDHFVCRGATVSVYNGSTSLNLENGSSFEIVGGFDKVDSINSGGSTEY